MLFETVISTIKKTSVEDFKDFRSLKASWIDQVSAKFLKDDTPVIGIHLTNIFNLLMKINTFSSKCKIAKIKFLFKKAIKTEAKEL